MPNKPQRLVRRRNRYPINRIKRNMTYDAPEIAKLIGVHRNTVRHWLKGGLETIDDRRPALIHGTELRAFLIGRRNARRQSCALGQFWCLKCRAPREAWGALADAIMQSEKVFRLTSLCAICETSVHRIVRAADLPKISRLLNLQIVSSTVRGTGHADAACGTINRSQSSQSELCKGGIRADEPC